MRDKGHEGEQCWTWFEEQRTVRGECSTTKGGMGRDLTAGDVRKEGLVTLGPVNHLKDLSELNRKVNWRVWKRITPQNRITRLCDDK